MSKTLVLITGANTGIGYEVVRKLAEDNVSSHQILLGTRTLAKGEAALKSIGSPSNVRPVQLDVTEDSSINRVFETIQTDYGKLDVLINNAGTAGLDLGPVKDGVFQPEGKSVREVYTHCYSVNVISSAVLVEKMVPLLEKSVLPKVIFMSSGLGSIALFSSGEKEFVPCPWYNSSKSAVNYMTAFYARKYPHWKVNAVCPGLNATGLNHVPLTEETDPKNGAIRACELVMEGKEGVSGTYSNKDGPIPW